MSWLASRRSMAPMAGVRGLLLDLDGVLVLQGKAIPGAQEAMAEIDRRGIPYRVVTNTSLVSRPALSTWGKSLGLRIPPDRIMSALSCSAGYTARTFPGALAVRHRVRGRPRRVRRAEAPQRAPRQTARAPKRRPSSSAIPRTRRRTTTSTAPSGSIRGGAQLIAMHKNRWWLTPAGPTLDSGAYVAGLEYAASVKALVLGKPSEDFFREASAALLEEISASSGGRPGRGDIAMVGDDLWTDVLSAQRLGLRGVFVLSGKHGREELTQAANAGRGGGVPDLVAGSMSEVVAALD